LGWLFYLAGVATIPLLSLACEFAWRFRKSIIETRFLMRGGLKEGYGWWHWVYGIPCIMWWRFWTHSTFSAVDKEIYRR
jgi:hypothetical protein